MKRILTLFLCIFSLFEISAQNEWQIDSAEVFQIFLGQVQSPNKYTYEYNVEGKILKESHFNGQREHFYGTHSYSLKNTSEFQNSTYFVQYNDDRQQLYSEFRNFDFKDSLLFESKRFNYRSERLDSIVEYTNGELVSKITYKYEGSILKEFERTNYALGVPSLIQKYTYTHDSDGRLLRFTNRSINEGYYDRLIVSEYYTGEQDTVITYRYNYDFFENGNMRVSRQEDEMTSISDQYTFLNEDLSDIQLAEINISIRKEFPQINLTDSEQYSVVENDTIISNLATSVLFEIDEDHFQVTTTNRIFTSDGNIDFLSTRINHYSRKKEGISAFDSEIEFKVFPNPVEVGGIIRLDINQKTDADFFMYDSAGRLIQRLDLGGEEHILVYAPGQAGVYFVGFEDGAGGRNVKQIVVH